MNYLLLAIVKIIDNIISTGKNITQYREMKILSSIFVAISQLIFYLLISNVLNDKTMLSIIIVSVASGIGNLIAFAINDKLKTDTKWSIVLTSHNKKDVSNLCDYLTDNKIKHIANYGCTRKGEDTIHVIAFSKSKQESRIIYKFIDESDSKYLVEVI